VQFGEKEEHYLSKIKKISWIKKKSSFFDSGFQLPFFISFLFFLFFLTPIYPSLPTVVSPLCNSARKKNLT